MYINYNAETMSIQLLQLLHLSDSALPIGATAHSFGVETLTAESWLDATQLEPFLRDYLRENGAWEAAYCRAAHGLVTHGTGAVAAFEARWCALNAQFASIIPARESRSASAALGRRFLQLLLDVHPLPPVEQALRASRAAGGDSFHPLAFGLAGGLLDVAAEETAAAYLHQSIAGLVSACQRLLPVGQSQAARLLWRLKPAVLHAVAQSEGLVLDGPDLNESQEISLFTPVLEIGSMRHPRLPVRLFIS